MNNNTLIALGVIVLILIAGGFWLSNREATTVDTENSENTEEDSSETVSETDTTDTSSEEEAEETEAGTVREFTISGENFSFSEDEIRVSQGDTVRVTFVNTGGMHDWRLEGYEVGTEVIQTGEQQTVEFVADETGSFEYYCSVGNHRAMGMVGTLIVE